MNQYEFFKKICLDETGLLCGIDEIIVKLVEIKQAIEATPTPEPTPTPTPLPCEVETKNAYVYETQPKIPTIKPIKIGKFN